MVTPVSLVATVESVNATLILTHWLLVQSATHCLATAWSVPLELPETAANIVRIGGGVMPLGARIVNVSIDLW